MRSLFTSPRFSKRKLLWILVAIGLILASLGAWSAYRETKSAPSPENVADPYNDFIDLALERGATGDAEGALKALDVAIAIHPDNAALAYYYRGLIKAQQGHYREAIGDFDQAIKADSRMAEAYAARATTYMAIDRPATAIEDFHKAVELEPEHAPTYVNRGQAYLQLGMKALALADFNYAIELNPELSAAYFNRGVLYLQDEKPQEAIKDFNTCLELDPSLPAPYFDRAIAYIQIQENNLAAADLTIFMQLSDDPDLRHQAEALLQSLAPEAIPTGTTPTESEEAGGK